VPSYRGKTLLVRGTQGPAKKEISETNSLLTCREAFYLDALEFACKSSASGRSSAGGPLALQS